VFRHQANEASAKCGIVFDACIGLCKILEKLKRLTVCVAGPALQGGVDALPCRAFVLDQRIQVAATFGNTAHLCSVTCCPFATYSKGTGSIASSVYFSNRPAHHWLGPGGIMSAIPV
jgi:hypothetical protein